MDGGGERLRLVPRGVGLMNGQVDPSYRPDVVVLGNAVDSKVGKREVLARGKLLHFTTFFDFTWKHAKHRRWHKTLDSSGSAASACTESSGSSKQFLSHLRKHRRFVS